MAGNELGKAYVDVVPDLRRFGGPLSAKMRAAGTDAGRHFSGSLTRGLAVGAAAGIGAVVLEIKKSVQAYTETEKVGRQTNQVIRSTGAVAGVTAKHVGALATAISRKSGIDDEAIQSTENLLLTFTNVRNEVGKGNRIFDQASRAVTDMSVALGQDGKSSAIQLGKALNDPVKGITALRRVGVSFTAQQQDQIKTLVKSGKTLEAQKLILHEVNREFGGSAAAQAQPIDKLKVSIGNIQEAIGSGFKPAIDSVATDLERLSNRALPDVQRAADDVRRTFGRKDLSLSAKIGISEHKLRRDLRPVITMAENEFKSAHVGDKISAAIEHGVPKMVDAAAKAAPHAAGAFINAFKNSSGWGKLLTAAFLAKKLGAFSSLGHLIAGQVGKGIAGSAIGGLKPVPVYVTNPGAGITGGAPGTGRQTIAGRALRNPIVGGVATATGIGAVALVGLDASQKDFRGFTNGIVKNADKIREAIRRNDPELAALRSQISRLATATGGPFASDARRAAHMLDGLYASAHTAAGGIRGLHREIAGLPRNTRVNVIADFVTRNHFGSNIPATKKSTGGMIAGSGSGDHIPALLEPGEYVIRKKVVSKTGRKFFDDLNAGRIMGDRWGPRPFSYAAQRYLVNASAFQRLDDVDIGYGGLKAALHTAASTPNLPQAILNTRTLANILQGGTGWHTGPRTHVAEMHNHFNTPAGAAPDARFAIAQLDRELARRFT